MAKIYYTWYTLDHTKIITSDPVRPRRQAYYAQSFYRKVAQGGVFSRAIHNWLWISSLVLAKKKFKKKWNFIFFYKRDIMI